MWDERRFFLKNSDDISDIVVVAGEEYSHMINVLRMRKGDKAVLLSGSGEEILTQIDAVFKNEVALKVIERRMCDREPVTQVTLFQAALKSDKMEFVVQKAVELGVSSIQPFTSKFCVGELSENKITRLKKIANEAVKQCKRAKRVQILSPISFLELPSKAALYGQKIFFNEREDAICLRGVIDKSICMQSPTCLVVGSEGGFSLDEAKILCESMTSVSLGKRVLRAETAAVAAITLVQYELGELE